MVAAKLSRLLISSSAHTIRADLEEDKALHMGAEGRGTQSAPGFDWTRSVSAADVSLRSNSLEA